MVHQLRMCELWCGAGCRHHWCTRPALAGRPCRRNRQFLVAVTPGRCGRRAEGGRRTAGGRAAAVGCQQWRAGRSVGRRPWGAAFTPVGAAGGVVGAIGGRRFAHQRHFQVLLVIVLVSIRVQSDGHFHRRHEVPFGWRVGPFFDG